MRSEHHQLANYRSWVRVMDPTGNDYFKLWYKVIFPKIDGPGGLDNGLLAGKGCFKRLTNSSMVASLVLSSRLLSRSHVPVGLVCKSENHGTLLYVSHVGLRE